MWAPKTGSVEARAFVQEFGTALEGLCSSQMMLHQSRGREQVEGLLRDRGLGENTENE